MTERTYFRCTGCLKILERDANTKTSYCWTHGTARKVSRMHRSPWFSGAVQPAHVGYYDRKCFTFTSYWDGKVWRWHHGPTAAKMASQNVEWRGLVDGPSHKP